MDIIKKRCKQCKKINCPYLYNEDYCLLNKEYIEDIKIEECVIVFRAVD